MSEPAAVYENNLTRHPMSPDDLACLQQLCVELFKATADSGHTDRITIKTMELIALAAVALASAALNEQNRLAIALL